MKDYITPEFSVIELDADIVTTSPARDFGDTPMADFNW